jgi:hypothetical protein
MPAMPRCNKVANKISYTILGPPENSIDIESPKQKKIKKELLTEDARWTK